MVVSEITVKMPATGHGIDAEEEYFQVLTYDDVYKSLMRDLIVRFVDGAS